MPLLGAIHKDLRWRAADPMSLLMWIGIPLLLGSLMALVFGSGQIQGKGTLLVVDQDDTIVTTFVKQAAAGAGPIQLEEVGLAEGRRRMDAGEASGLLVIPAGFSAALLDDEPTDLELTLNPSQQVFPKMIQGGVEILAEAEFYLQRLGGDLIRDLAKMQPTGQSSIVDSLLVGAFAVKVNNRLQAFEPLLLPPALTVADELTPAQENPKAPLNFGVLLFPGILFMSLMFMAQGISYDLWRERDQGTLARQLCAPIGALRFLVAKAVAGGITMGVVALVGLVGGHLWFGLPAASIPLALGWIVFAGVALLMLFFFVQMLAGSGTGGNVLTSVLMFPLMMLGGSFMPFESMPAGMRAIGALTPNGLAVEQLGAIVRGESGLGPLATAMAILGGMGGLFFMLAARRLRSGFVGS